MIHNVLKTNPVSWFLLTADLAWEKVLSQHLSVQLGSTYTFQSGEVFDGLTANLTGYSISPEMRYYWTPFKTVATPVRKNKVAPNSLAAPVSFYTAVWGKMADYKASIEFPDHPGEKAEFYHRRSYSGGVNFGSQFWLKFRKKPVILCDVSLGGGWINASTETKLAEYGKRIKLERKGFSPHFGFRVGVPLN